LDFKVLNEPNRKVRKEKSRKERKRTREKRNKRARKKLRSRKKRTRTKVKTKMKKNGAHGSTKERDICTARRSPQPSARSLALRANYLYM
jgi:ribosomal protein L9